MKRKYIFALFITAFLGFQLNTSLLQTKNVISTVQTAQKVVAISIDDGPHPKTTPEILAILKEKNIHATFFVLGSNVEANQSLLAQEVAEGHEIGSHAFSHQALTKLTKAQVNNELDKTESLITLYAPKPLLFRPPRGLFNETVLDVVRQKGYSTVLWTIDPHDWARPSVEEVINQVLSKVKPGSIILLHDGQYPLPTPKSLPIIIDKLRAQGYEFVTISELLQYNEIRHSYRLIDEIS